MIDELDNLFQCPIRLCRLWTSFIAGSIKKRLSAINSSFASLLPAAKAFNGDTALNAKNIPSTHSTKRRLKSVDRTSSNMQCHLNI